VSFSLTRLASQCGALFTRLPAIGAPPRLCVALSGGLDSTVLLVALARLQRAGSLPARLRALHVDHGLHADSASWALACARLAADWSVQFESVRVTVPLRPGASPEAAAREARYAALAAGLHPGEVLLTAHHADDQLETILLQWLRGGGLRAVAGMAPLGPFGHDAWHARPLLEFTRDDMAGWATAQGLRWLEDPSNQDLRFDRNYLRLAVLPVLRQRWPGVAHTAGRVAEFARDALLAEAATVARDLPAVLRGNAVDLQALLSLDGPRVRAVLRAWLAGLGLPPPPARTLASLLHDVRHAAADRNPGCRWPGAAVHRYRGHLHAVPTAVPQAVAVAHWNGAGRLAWAEHSTLELVADCGRGLSRERLPATFDIVPRRPGSTFRPAGGAHRRPLRKWLQEREVLPWRRDALPLLCARGQLLAVADLGVAAEFAAGPGEPSWRVVWHGRGAVTAADAFAGKWPADPLIG
jgi:tRNA(Ile)-lysidine synthase